MNPRISTLCPNLYKISFSDSEAGTGAVLNLPETENDDFTPVLKDNGIICSDEKGLLFTLSQPVFTEYDIVSDMGGNTEIRQTIDGIKVTKVGGTQNFVRKSFHGDFSISYKDDIFFGLGSHEEGFPFLNGHVFHMIQENMRIAVPFFVSTKGYALLINNGSYMRFDFCETNTSKIHVDCADNLEIFVFTGGRDKIYENYRHLTGKTPLPPKWFCGYIQSKERYTCQHELTEVVREYRRRRVPLDCIVQDWFYWNNNMWGEKILDLSRYPDLKTCIDEIHENKAHLMISIWPNMSGGGENQTEFKKNDLLLGDGSVYDAFSKKGREIYWKQAREGLFKYGVDAWWCDSSEPYDANWEGECRRSTKETVERSINEFKKYIDDAKINLYSLNHSRGIYENQRKESGKRVLNLTRSGFAGQHRYGTVAWSGDISASWETLKKQVHILQNYISTGEAYWNSDIGGFFVKKGKPWFWNGEFDEGVNDEGYRELYLRWLQFAGFTPMMRSHGTDTPREIWQFGEEGTVYYDAIKAAIELRYRLMPYFYSLNARVTLEGKMPVMPVLLAFPEEISKIESEKMNKFLENEVSYEYIYGDNLLVCPVLKPGLTEMTIYLPSGIWYDFYTGEKFIGGKTITIPLSLDRIPVFARAGAIIPTQPVMQYTDEIPDSPVSLLIFGGANGEFLLYNDAGDGYDYESGKYSLIRLSYEDKTHSLNCEELADKEFARKIIWENK